jgi:hypothetical protein
MELFTSDFFYFHPHRLLFEMGIVMLSLYFCLAVFCLFEANLEASELDMEPLLLKYWGTCRSVQTRARLGRIHQAHNMYNDDVSLLF